MGCINSNLHIALGLCAGEDSLQRWRKAGSLHYRVVAHYDQSCKPDTCREAVIADKTGSHKCNANFRERILS